MASLSRHLAYGRRPHTLIRSEARGARLECGVRFVCVWLMRQPVGQPVAVERADEAAGLCRFRRVCRFDRAISVELGLSY